MSPKYFLSVVALIIGVNAFIVGAVLFDWRLGIAAAGLTLVAGALLIDDGT